MSLLLLSLMYFLRVSTSKRASRAEELSRASRYELVHFDFHTNLSSSTSTPAPVTIIEFVAFGQKYILHLTPDHNTVASSVRHNHKAPTPSADAFFSSLTASCHYNGRVLDAPDSSVALSLCDKRGVRGHVHAFNDTLVIKPAAYYLRPSQKHHGATDEHLIFKLSEFDTSDFGRSGAFDVEPLVRSLSPSSATLRRRMKSYYNSGQNEVELLIISGPIRTAHYQQDYESEWFEHLLADYVDDVHLVSAIYSSTNWNSADYDFNIGSISVKLVEVEVLFSFSGSHASLAPAFEYPSCRDYAECDVDGNDWLGVIQDWLNDKNAYSTFDHAMMVSDLEFEDGFAGWGNIGTMCRAGLSASTVSALWGDTWRVTTMAHEMGHNFGMGHDGEGTSKCAKTDGLMGYGGVQYYFSACSIDALNFFFELYSSGITCLGRSSSGSDDVRSNYDPNGGSSIDDSEENNGGDSEESISWDCVGVRGLSLSGTNYDINGYWTPTSTNDVFTLNGHFLYFLDSSGVWVMGSSVGSTSGLMAYCSGADIEVCDWSLLNAQRSWIKIAGAEVYNCENGGDPPPEESEEDTDFACSYHDCVSFFGLIADRYGRTFNFEWTPSGCFNGESYYTASAASGFYLCYNTVYERYMISDTLCATDAQNDIIAYSSPMTTDLMATQGNWVVRASTLFAQSKDVVVYECGGNAKFESDECLEAVYDDGFEDALCLSTVNAAAFNHSKSLWSDAEHFTFERNTEMCSYGRAVFQFAQHRFVELDEDEDVDADEGATWFLHYAELLEWSDSNVTTPQWLISADSASTNAAAVCEEARLSDCVAGAWRLLTTTRAVQGQRDYVDGLVQWLSDAAMTVSDGRCPGDELVDDAAPMTSSSDASVVAIVAVLALVAILVIASLVCTCRACRAWRRLRMMKTRQRVPKDEDIPNGTHTEQTSPLSQNVDGHAHDLNEEIEIEVEMEMQTKGDGTTTATYI